MNGSSIEIQEDTIGRHAVPKDVDLERPATLPLVHAKAALEALDCQVIASMDSEAVEFLVASAKAKIWSDAYRNEEGKVIEEVMESGTSEYANRVRQEFLEEFKAAGKLVIPEGYAFSSDFAYQVFSKRSITS